MIGQTIWLRKHIAVGKIVLYTNNIYEGIMTGILCVNKYKCVSIMLAIPNIKRTCL